MFADEPWRHLRVGVQLFLAAIAIELNLARSQDASADARGAFDFAVAAQFFVFHRRDFDVDVDAVEQRARNFRDVALNLRGRAVAFARGIAEESARARIHRGSEHEARRKRDGKRGTSDGHAAFFERLAHHFQDVALELRQLVKKNDAVVAERYFSRARHRAAADQSRITDGMVRGAERPRADQTARRLKDSRDAVNPRGLDGFLERHRRHDRGDALGQHGFAGAGRANQQNVVATRAGNFQRAFRGHLAAHVTQIDRVLAGFGEHLRSVHGDGLKRFRRVDHIHSLRQRLYGEDVDAFDDGGFARIRFGDHDVLYAAIARRQRGGEGAAHGTDAAVQRELAEKHVRVENLPEKRALASHQTEGHGQIERGTFLSNVSGREVDRDSLIHREIEAAISERGFDSLAAFLHRNVRQSDDVEIALVAGADVYLDFHEIGVDAKHGGAKCFEEHPKKLGTRRESVCAVQRNPKGQVMPAILPERSFGDLALCYPRGGENDAMRKGPNWTVCSLALIFVFGSSLVVRAQSQGNNSEAAVSLNNQGLQLFQQGKVDEAIVQYRRALAIRPDFPEALSNLGLALDAKGNDVEALADLDKALTLKPGDAVTESNRGLAFYHEGKYDDSIAAYRQAISFNARFPQAYNGMGAALLAAGKPDEAIAAYHEALRLQPNYVDALNNLGAALDSKKRWDEAILVYQQALKIEPKAMDIRANLASALQGAGRTDDAVFEYREIVAARPNDGHAFFQLGHLLYEQGKFPEAIEALEKSFALLPHEPETAFNLGRAYQDAGNLSAAVQAYQKGLVLNPDDLHGLYNLGNAYLSLKQPAKAEISFRKALELQPDFAVALQGLGIAQMQAGELDKAEASLLKLTAMQPDNADAHFNLGNAFFNRGKYTAAADAYREAIRLNANLAHAHYNLAMALLRLNNPVAADKEFREAVRIDPTLTPPK